MKTLKSILIAATLISASVVSTLSAQQAEPAQTHEFKVAIGDSVMIKRECQQYCTGERPSVWVWDKVHTVRQLGTKKFPDGVLLMNIYSWMCEECLIPVNHHAKEAQAQAEAEQKEEREAFEQAQQAQQGQAAQGGEQGQAAQGGEQGQAAEGGEQSQAAEGGEQGQAAQGGEQGQAAEGGEQGQVAQGEEQEPEQIAQPGDTLVSKQQFKHDYDRFTIGARVGVASQLHQPIEKVNAKWGVGFDAMLDLQYAHYWSNDARPVDLGIIVGLGIGYAQGTFNGSQDTVYQAGDNNEITYHVTADNIRETDRQLQLEVPLMFSLIHDNGLFFNIGPKFMIPVYTPYKQTVNSADASITAVYPEEGITIKDNIVTGKYIDQQPTEDNGIQFKVNVMLTAEIGYEWILKSGNSLGLGAYANYCVYNNFSNQYKNAAAGSADSRPSLLDITAPTDAAGGAIADLNMLSATRTYADKLGYFDAGIKLAYHFNFPKKQYKHFKESKLF